MLHGEEVVILDVMHVAGTRFDLRRKRAPEVASQVPMSNEHQSVIRLTESAADLSYSAVSPAL